MNKTRQAIIHVTRKHIWRADMGSIKTCVIARSIRESLPLVSDVWVGVNDASLVHPLEEYVPYHKVELPRLVAAFITTMMVLPRFLRPLFLWPFSFTLDVPEQFLPVEPKRYLSPRVTASAASVLQEKG